LGETGWVIYPGLVFVMVAVGLEDVEALVLDLPSRPGTGHDLGDGVSRDGQ